MPLQKLQTKLELVLKELKEQIIIFVETDRLGDASFLLKQYIKLAPTFLDRYSLEALIRAAEEDWSGAEKILNEGLSVHPLSFDLLYNLGYIFEEKQEILQAYHSYMRARYIAEGEREKTDIAAALKRLVPQMAGSVKSQDGEISTVLRAGEIAMAVTTRTEELLKRKELLGTIEKHIDKNASTVLEIGFKDGIISKNLNYFGYDVTAVDPIKERILNVIAGEWHDNLLQAEQKVAKFYYEIVDLEWVQKIPEFDVIIAVADKNIDIFATREEQASDLLKALLQKARKQLFIRVSDGHSPKEFSKADLAAIAASSDSALKTIAAPDQGDEQIPGGLSLCLINKHSEPEPFSVPIGAAAQHSKSTIFEVELKKCVDLYGAGYVDDRQHFVEMLRQYREDPELQYEDSFLKAYYECFQPRNTEETLFVHRGKAPKLRSGWIGLPWFGDKNKKVVFVRERGETRPGGNHHFGPNSDEFGHAEFGRLIRLYELFKKEGYQPELFSDGYISGYLLSKRGDYRFVISEGQHRVACLAALGYEKIRCRFT